MVSKVLEGDCLNYQNGHKGMCKDGEKNLTRVGEKASASVYMVAGTVWNRDMTTTQAGHGISHLRRSHYKGAPQRFTALV